ncbi:hypothetical protein KAU11_01220, partial [Candidatus Babeliales bacterium]|nr:hypothetical protein [Candidatus Babeliales bacterium]
NPDKGLDGKARVGVVNGLAYSTVAGNGVGGSVLKIESVIVPGDGEINVSSTIGTGDMMKTSANAAKSFLNANSHKFGIAKDRFRKSNLHVHIPCVSGVDGPSAGIAMTCAILSAVTGKKVRGNWAMTGEVDLHGNVRAIGGVRDKVLGARSCGVTNIILPEENRVDWEEVADNVPGVHIEFVSTFDQVAKLVLLD